MNFSNLFTRLRRIVFAAALFLFGGGIVLAQSIVPADQQTWDYYKNAKYGVSVSFPSRGFLQQPTVNDFGQTYLSNSSEVIITAFGNHWDENASQFSDYRSEQRAVLENLGANITYAPGGDTWFVFSGFLWDDIFYFKSTTNRGCSVAGHIYFKFPAVIKGQVSGIIEYMEDSLRLGASDECPAG